MREGNSDHVALRHRPELLSVGDNRKQMQERAPQAEEMVPGECLILLFRSMFAVFKEEQRGKHGLKKMRERRIIADKIKSLTKWGAREDRGNNLMELWLLCLGR